MSKTFIVPSGAEVKVDNDSFITTEVVLDISTLIDHDLEGVLDLLSLGATGTELLCDINYRPLSITPQGCIVFEVGGDISMILDMAEETQDDVDITS